MGILSADLNDRLPTVPAMPEKWRWDKGVSIPTLFSILAGLVGNVIMITWFAASMSGKVDGLEHRISVNEQNTHDLILLVSDMRVAIGAINGVLDIRHRPTGGGTSDSP